MKILRAYLAIIMLFLFTANAGSQSVYLYNPSLEGPANTDYPPPPGWSTGDTWSNPNIFSYYQPPGSSIQYTAVDGETFLLFRSRGATYAETFFSPYQREYIYQHLLRPLETQSCFKFTASLCFNSHHSVADSVDPNVAYPLKVQLWGGTGPNSRQILLVDSDPISNTSWENHTFYFTTYDVSYSYVLLEVQWDTLTVQPRAYNGYTLIDNLGLDYVGPADTSIEHTIYYRGDNQMTLTPDNTGSRYQWFPEGNVADHSARSPIVTDYTETISVYVQQDNDCPILEIFHLILDCDTLYPERLVNTVDYYYRYEDSLILTASGGQTWSWEPQVHLSAYDIQSPRLLDFHELYTVTITDEYGCEFQENFNIILHCDTLYPGGTLVVIDTVLTEVADFVLEPRYGIHISEWTPTLYMSCMDCVYPMVTPISTITYSVELIDDFECIHTELFRFEVMLIIPNVITPNDDGYNDCFNVLGLPPNTTFRLFDKTGRSIVTVESYETVDCWAGTDNAGRPLGSGTYWYAFEDASSHTLAKGFLFIKR